MSTSTLAGERAREVLRAALGYAKNGYYVVPWRVIPNGTGKPKKVPALDGWQLSEPPAAPPDVDRVHAMWGPGGTHEGLNVGILTGWRWKEGGPVPFAAWDVDVADGRQGAESWTRLMTNLHIADHDTATLTATTPTKGRHFLFDTREPVGTKSQALEGYPDLDTRGVGGYIGVWPSLVNGAGYEWTELQDPSLMPEALEQKSPRPGRAETDRETQQVPGDAVDPQRAKSRALALIGQQEGAKQGSRGITAYKLAARLKDFGCDRDTTFDLLRMFWVDRCEPPMPDEDLADSVDHAYTYGKEPPGCSAPEAQFDAIETPTDPLDGAEHWTADEVHQHLGLIEDRWPAEPIRLANLFGKWLDNSQVADADRARLTHLANLHDQRSHLNIEDRSDVGNANLLYRLTGGDLRFVVERDMWLWWDGQQWNPDPSRIHATEAARLVGQHYAKDLAQRKKKLQEDVDSNKVSEKEEKEIRKALASMQKWVERCWGKHGLDAMLDILARDSRVTIQAGELDKDPWLLGVQNGVVDLRTGQLRPASRDEFVTKRAAVAFDPSARAPRWLQFVDEITGRPTPPEIDPTSGRPIPGTVGRYAPRPALASYIHRALGYATTGSTQEQKMLIAIGDGSNGKNVLLDVVKEALGDYARSIAPEALMSTRHDADAERASPTAASLAGARLAVGSESKDGARLDVALVKAHTGNRFMTARRMRENTFEFIVTHKLWLMTNHRPSLDHMDEPLRGRLHLIPFDRKWNRPGHPERDETLPDGDPGLMDRLRAEMAGILSWLVEGAVLYQKDRLEPPAEVTNATTDYFAEQDPLAQWLALFDRCEPRSGTKAAELWKDYQQWSRDEDDWTGKGPSSTKAFGQALKNRHGILKQDLESATFYGLTRKRPS